MRRGDTPVSKVIKIEQVNVVHTLYGRKGVCMVNATLKENSYAGING